MDILSPERCEDYQPNKPILDVKLLWDRHPNFRSRPSNIAWNNIVLPRVLPTVHAIVSTYGSFILFNRIFPSLYIFISSNIQARLPIYRWYAKPTSIYD